MRNHQQIKLVSLGDITLAGVSLLILILFTFAFFVETPYLGFSMAIPSPKINYIFINPDNADPIQLGDVLIRMDTINLVEAINNYSKPILPNFQKGDQVPLLIQRGSQTLHFLWTIPGPNGQELTHRLRRSWSLAYVYWGFGLLTMLLIRPKDNRWRLMIAFYYCVAIWISVGTTSGMRIWYSGVLIRAISWLLLPIALHFHWIFPHPLAKISHWWGRSIYLIAIVFFFAELFLLVPFRAYHVAIGLSALGSLGLLIIHVWQAPKQRQQLRFFLLVALLIMLVGIEISLLFAPSGLTLTTNLSLIFITLLPFGYFYAIYSRQSGGFELRRNRSTGLIIFVALVALAAIITIISISIFLPNLVIVNLSAAIIAVLVAITTTVYYPRFQIWFERQFLDMPVPPANLLSWYAARLASSLEISHMISALKDHVFPALLVRQVALLRISTHPGSDKEYIAHSLLQIAVSDAQIPPSSCIPNLLTITGNSYWQESPSKILPDPCQWVKLCLPLLVEGEIIGLCLFGRRDPDDYYSPAELPLLQALMGQTALALIHIEQATRLRAFYQYDIQRQEDERSRLARDLHDEVLGQMTILVQSLQGIQLDDRFHQTYQIAIQRIRDLIAGLRPATLNFGLHAALEDLIDEMVDQSEQRSQTLQLSLEIEDEIQRYPADIELQIYRIVQEACQNALDHASPSWIRISGSLQPSIIQLAIHDDGAGFTNVHAPDLTELLANRHYGLVGMYERAALINAQLTIDSSPTLGTRVLVIWKCAD